MKIVSINISENSVHDFTSKCKAMGYSRNKMLIKLIIAFNEGRLSLDKDTTDKLNDQLFNKSPVQSSSIPTHTSPTPLSDIDDHKHNPEFTTMLTNAKHNAPQQSVGEAMAEY